MRYKRQAEYWQNMYEQEKSRVENRDKLLKRLKEQENADITELRLKAGKAIEKLEKFILELKKIVFGKGTIVEKMEALEKSLLAFKLE